MSSKVLATRWSALRPQVLDRAVSFEEIGYREARLFVGPHTPSVSIDEAHEACDQALFEAAQEASQSNWDAQGAEAVSGSTVAQAVAFLDVLPTALPRPDISVHPDGEVAFEWSARPGWVVTVSVNEWGRLSYAALLGPARVHGVELLLDALPEGVVVVLRRLYAAR